MLSGAITGITPESGLYFFVFQIMGALVALMIATALRPRKALTS
jgi:hypothetical protein